MIEGLTTPFAADLLPWPRSSRGDRLPFEETAEVVGERPRDHYRRPDVKAVLPFCSVQVEQATFPEGPPPRPHPDGQEVSVLA